MINKIILFTCLILLYSCSTDTNPFREGTCTQVDKFPVNTTLKGEKLNIEILGVNNLYIADTFLLGFRAFTGESFYSVYSTNTLKYLGEFLPRGKGPNEFISILHLGEYKKDSLGVKLWHQDGATDHIFLANLTQSLAQQKSVVDSIRYKTIYEYSLSYNLNDSTFAVLLYQNDNLFSENYDCKNKRKTSKKTFFKEYSPKTIKMLEDIRINIKPDYKKFVISTTYMNLLHFYTSNYDSCFTISIYNKPANPNEISRQLTDTPPKYFYDIRSSNEYVVALYLQPHNESTGDTNKAEFQFFNWNGEPLLRLSIPEEVTLFALDEKHSCLYGLTLSEEIFRYDFKEFLHKKSGSK